MASTHVEEDACHAGHSPALYAASCRTVQGQISPLLAHFDCHRSSASARPRANPLGLSGLGIKPKTRQGSPKMGGQGGSERHMSNLCLGDRALPKLTDAFPQTQSTSFGRGAGDISHLCAEDVSWCDHEAMKAKYAAPCAWQGQSRKIPVKFENIRKVTLRRRRDTALVSALLEGTWHLPFVSCP